MDWKIEFSKEATKTFLKLAKPIQILISSWIYKHLLKTDDPRIYGKPLTGNLKGLWRYRIGDYRLICDIHDYVMTIEIIDLGHRKEIYK